MNNIRSTSTRQQLKPNPYGVCRMGLYVNDKSSNLFYAQYDEHASNRIKPTDVYIDNDGAICIDVDRRNLTTT